MKSSGVLLVSRLAKVTFYHSGKYEMSFSDDQN